MKKIRGMRGLVFIVALIISALITPPDIISQLIITVPFYLSFEAGIFITKFQGGEK